MDLDKKMKNIECRKIFSDEFQENLGVVDLYEGIDVFRTFPWKEENKKAEITGVFPAVSFAVAPSGKNRDYLNISQFAQPTYDIQIEIFKTVSYLKVIPWRKSSSLFADGISNIVVEQFITNLYKFPKDSLFDWVKTFKKAN
jgi:hypothetical protein